MKSVWVQARRTNNKNRNYRHPGQAAQSKYCGTESSCMVERMTSGVILRRRAEESISHRHSPIAIDIHQLASVRILRCAQDDRRAGLASAMVMARRHSRSTPRGNRNSQDNQLE